MKKTSGILIILLFSLGLWGCQTPQLMKTPNLYATGDINPFFECPPEYHNNEVDVLYITDRAVVDRRGGNKYYGFGRSPSVAFGSCKVEIGDEVPWDVLVDNSRGTKRSTRLPLRIESTEEIGRFPATPYPKIRKDGRLEVDPGALAARDQLAARFRAEMSRRFEAAPRKEVFLFVHGYNNSFEDSIFVMANLWHFMGRQFVPVVYSWPAGRGGLRGYGYDRESGEFTIFHLKNTLRFLASCEEIEKIHILCHSRGTDVASSAIRELLIEARAEGVNPREKLKIANLILAAPDLDLEVVQQRFGAENFSDAVENLTLYISQTDKALGLSGWLFDSVQRLGRVDLTQLRSPIKDRAAQATNQTVIDARVKSGFIGHSYFHSDPAVSSDLILNLRYSRPPGRENGRPLTELGSNFWRLEKGYPNIY